MGISGLLRELAQGLSSKGIHIETYANKRAVVDASTWLYRGCYCCAREIALGIPTRKFLNWIMRRVRCLQHFNISIIMVFDGESLPLKCTTNATRRENKKKALARAKQLELDSTKTNNREERRRLWKKAEKFYRQAYSPKRQHVDLLISTLKRINIDYVIAPYEADAQLVYMCRPDLKNIKPADIIITEDSDLLVFCASAKVSVPVLFKMCDNGIFQQVVQISTTKDNYLQVLSSPDECGVFVNKLRCITPRMFVQCCIIAGCDYCPTGISGLGLKKAQDMLLKYKDISDDCRIAEVCSYIQNTKKTSKKTSEISPSSINLQLATNVKKKLLRSELCFMFQSVINPWNCQITSLRDMPQSVAQNELMKNLYSLSSSDQKELKRNQKQCWLSASSRGDMRELFEFLGAKRDIELKRASEFVAKTLQNPKLFMKASIQHASTYLIPSDLHEMARATLKMDAVSVNTCNTPQAKNCYKSSCTSQTVMSIARKSRCDSSSTVLPKKKAKLISAGDCQTPRNVTTSKVKKSMQNLSPKRSSLKSRPRRGSTYSRLSKLITSRKVSSTLMSRKSKNSISEAFLSGQGAFKRDRRTPTITSFFSRVPKQTSV